ncbi:uncharacterized protein LOC100371869 [Saccoglossus kowalevskii]|uniref:Uncharacterized protein LOC100371869 n=1 Tax=Saccoglossus kowalevskii TaxID=10224 RepID=A0ABM0M8J3_SACKO|nr:PREDICTED: uncharacterized protein LOC100371869 [Saccoglossus kowalevskii]
MPSDDTIRFCKHARAEEWRNVFELYDKVLELKADKITRPKGKEELIELDRWCQEELPIMINSRDDKHITHKEITKLMKWKLNRGKFRPRLAELIQTNSEEAVVNASKKAFQCLPDLTAAIQALTVLKAVGPATASAVLAAGAPDQAAFMADESMLAFPELTPLEYTLKQYMRYIEVVNKIVKRLHKEDPETRWNPHSVELSLWTHVVASQIDCSLLEETKKKRKTEEDNKPRKKKQKKK